jgi:tripartite-type tricarboxylate transporter receptor subunit TctC
MTRNLKRAFEAASRLPAEQQDELAAAILEELVADSAWEKALKSSDTALGNLAHEALEEYRSGKAEPLDPETL